jgi:signal transduction histidine kinase
MIAEVNPPIPAASRPAKKSPNYARHLLRAISIAAAATLLIVLLFFSLGRFQLSETALEVLMAFVYCTSIALPSMVVLTWVSHRFNERFPRLVVLLQAVAQVGAAVAGALAAGAILVAIGVDAPGNYWRHFHGIVMFCIVISLLFGLSITAYETLRYKLQETKLELRTRQVEQERAYKLLAEARLSSLESRIHPHFLFNTLNSIAALIPTDPARAEDTVGKLASLLRFTLNAGQASLVPLAQELHVVRDYLEIEATRFGPRLRYDIAVPAAMDDVRVPPLALQSLVENSIKHVVFNRTESTTILVTGGRDAGRAHLEVTDDGPGFSLDAIAPEHGLGNLIARLELLYGGAGSLEVLRSGDNTTVRISFPA